MGREIVPLALVFLATVASVLAIFSYAGAQRTSYTLELLARREEMGNWLPQRFQVRAGDKVRVLIRNVDTVAHGIRMPDFGIEDVVLPAGQTKVIEFTAEKLGTFPFSCTVPCSLEHMGMRGAITVTAP